MSRGKRRRQFSLEFKKMAVRRMLKGESPSALCKELKVLRKDLYAWKNAHAKGKALVNRPGPKDQTEAEKAHKSAEAAWAKVAELERKIGQQELELDFFAKALHCIEQKNSVEASTGSSRRKQRKAN